MFLLLSDDVHVFVLFHPVDSVVVRKVENRYQSLTIHVWYIYLHLVVLNGIKW